MVMKTCYTVDAIKTQEVFIMKNNEKKESRNNNLTELVFILDRSGSMSGMESDTVGGFNSMLKKQQAAEGEAFVTTVLFNSELQTLHDRVPVGQVRPLTNADYSVGGCTALMDAIGVTIEHIAMIHKYARPEDVPARTLFVITTDGLENASRRFSSDEVKRKIKKETEKYGWEFIFVAANIDAVETAKTFGIREDRAVNYKQDAQGTALVYETVSEVACSMRSGAPLRASWKKKLKDDVDKRGQ